jgi:type IV pilus assembly protein PilC
MPRYKYIAEGNDGFAANGTIEAESPAGAGLLLMERGLFVKKLTEQKSILQYEIARKRVSRKDLMHFSRQLAVFLRAGVPIIDALDIIRQELPPKKLLGSVLADMIEALRSGSTFTAAAVTHPEAFPPFYIGVLEAAEMTGHLDHSLDEVANYIDRDLEARRKVQSALFYPAVVFLMSVATVLVLTAFVLPRFKTFFEELNAELPLPTRMLLAGSGLLSKGWPLILLLLVGSIGTVVYGLRTEQGRAIRDHLLLRIPVVGDLVRTAIIERFCRTLSSMVRSGVPLPDALVVAANGTNNVVYREGLSEVQAMMLEGRGLAGPIATVELFPGAARQMIRVGEETGTLDTQLETAAMYYERDLDFKIARFTNLFEPAVILFMGVVVGFVAVALISAMYGIFGQISSVG